MRISRRHKSTKKALKDLVEGLIPTVMERFGESVTNAKHAWRGDDMEFSFRARGFNIKGTLHVTDAQVNLDLRLPFAAKLFESKIKPAVERELDKVLDGLT